MHPVSTSRLVRCPLLAGLALALLAGGAARAGSPIPDSRSIDWTRSGVPGGVPHRTTVYATINAATYGNGTTDASGVINTAIANCPSGQVVYLPAGTYRLASTVTFGMKTGVTLRGAGPGKTVLKPADGLGAAITTGQAGQSAERQVTGGSTKGSTAITVSSASGIAPGTILDIYQDDDPDFYWTRGLTRHTGQFVMVTAVSGNTIQFQDPLVWGFNLNPRFKYQTNPGISWLGVEDLTVSPGAAYGGSMIQFWNAYASWIRNVETAWGNGNEHIFLYGCLRCEVRDSYIHDTHSTTDGYGIVTMAGYGGPRGGCTGTLIENNIFSGLWCSIILETEVGSVVGYNYSRNARFPGWPDYQIQEFNGNHGPHGMMCLFEGNIAGGLQQDGYHGSVSHTTYFRNWFSGQHVDANRTGNIKCIDLCRFSYYQNVVGNVLGNPNWPRTTTGRYEMTGMPDYTAQTCIYRLGYPNMGNNSYSLTNPPSNADAGGHDPKVKTTLMRWGNFDYQGNATRWEAGELPAGVPVPASHALPVSLYKTAKPSWWGSLPWPPIGPDVTPMVNKLPAQARYEGGNNRPPEISAFSPANPVAVPAGTTQPFSVEAWDPEGDALAYAWKLDGATVPVTISTMNYSPVAADAGSHTVVVTVSDGRGGSVSQTWAVTVTKPGGTLRDFTGDGQADILWRETVTGKTVLWAMNGATKTASAYTSASASTAWAVAGIADFTGDGKADILWREAATGKTVLWTMNGAAKTASAYTSASASTAWVVAGAADFTGDGKADILWRETATGKTVLWTMNGAAKTASAYTSASASTAWGISGLADFTGDGKADILWRETATGKTVLWTMNGAAKTASAYTSASASNAWAVAGAADFTGDGKADILWRETATGKTVLWTMNGATKTASAYTSASASTVWSVVQLSDFTGDGKADILWRETATGKTVLWTMSGATKTASAYTSASAGTGWAVQ